MNIFVLSLNILACATFHCDQHVIKMILESAQMLCSAVLLSGGQAGYKLVHSKHPCTLWVLESLTNWKWLRDLAFALNDEYKYRYKREVDHKSIAVIKDLKTPNIPDKGLTPFAQAMPDEFRDSDPVKAYRQYYAGAKHKFATWKVREIPDWYKDLRKEMGGNAVREVSKLLNPETRPKKQSKKPEKQSKSPEKQSKSPEKQSKNPEKQSKNPEKTLIITQKTSESLVMDFDTSLEIPKTQRVTRNMAKLMEISKRKPGPSPISKKLKPN